MKEKRNKRGHVALFKQNVFISALFKQQSGYSVHVEKEEERKCATYLENETFNHQIVEKR